MNSSLGTYIDLLLGKNDNVEEFNYGYGPSSTLIALTDRCKVYEDDEDCDDESMGDGDVQHDVNISSFLTLHQVMKNEQRRYVSVDAAGCDVSNKSDPDDIVESTPV